MHRAQKRTMRRADSLQEHVASEQHFLLCSRNPVLSLLSATQCDERNNNFGRVPSVLTHFLRLQDAKYRAAALSQVKTCGSTCPLDNKVGALVPHARAQIMPECDTYAYMHLSGHGVVPVDL
jgi:hypothetical protein